MANMHYRLPALLLLLFCLNSLSAQQRGIYFIDSLTGAPISFVEINELEQNHIHQTNSLGYFDATAVSETHILVAQSLGYAWKLLRLDTLTTPMVALQPSVVQLNEIRIHAPSKPAELKKLAQIDVHLRPVQNAQDLLRVVPGLFIGQHAGGGKAEQIFLRGFDIDHGTDIAITADGIPVNMVSHAHGQGYADLHFLIPELVEGIDFDKGPYRADKGNFATAGYVDLRTQHMLEKSFLKTEIGQFKTQRVVTGIRLLPARYREKNQHLYWAGEGMRTQGYFDSPQQFHRFNTQLKYHGSLRKGSVLTASLSRFNSRWNASGQIPDRAVNSGQIGFYGAIDDDEGGQTSRTNAQAQHTAQLNNGALLKNQVYFSQYRFELFSNFTFFKENAIDGDQIRQRENRYLFGYQSQYLKDNNILGVPGQLETGIQVRTDIVNDILLSRTKQRMNTLSTVQLGDIFEINSGGYIMQRWLFTPKWELHTGGRIDDFRYQYQDDLAQQKRKASTLLLSPKLNLHYKLNAQTSIYLNNGRGFHSNDSRVATDPSAQKRVLPPAYGTDLGTMFKLNEQCLVQAALWHLYSTQEFVYVGDEGIVETGEASRRYGLDASVRYQINKNFFADIDFTYAHTRTGTDFSEFIPLAPRFTSTGGFVYKRLKGLNASLRYRYLSDRAANADNSLIAKGYCILDANIYYALPHWEIGLAAQNLLNTRWKETQFETESRLQNEPAPVTEIHFTPGTPLAVRAYVMWRF